MGLYGTLGILLLLTLWKPRLSLYLFVLFVPLVSVFQGLGWDPRVGWACFLGFRAVFSFDDARRPVDLRVVGTAIIFFVVSASVLKLNVARLSPEDASSAWTFFFYFIAGSVFMFAASRLISTKKEAIHSLIFLGVAATEVALFAVWQAYTIQTNNTFDRVGSTLINPNALASFMNVSAITFLSASRVLPTRRWQIFRWSVFSLSSLALLLSLSRAALIAFFIGLLLVWATARGVLSAKRTIIILGLSLLMAVGVYTAVRSYRIEQAAAQISDVEQRRTEIAQSMEDFTRYEAAMFSLDKWTQHPMLGIGFETLAAVNYEKNGFYITTHDTILQLLVGTGLLGTVLVGYILMTLWSGLTKHAKILLIPIVTSVGVNSLFIDFLGVLDMMGAVALAYLFCKLCACEGPSITVAQSQHARAK